MRVQRYRAASLPLSALVLGSVLAWPVYGQTAPPVRRHGVHHRIRRTADDIDIVPADLPAGVTITPADLQPGDGTRDALSRIVADPDKILESYAPVRGVKSAPRVTVKETIPIRAAVLAPLDAPVLPPRPVPVASAPPMRTAPPVKVAAPAPALTVAAVPVSAPAVPSMPTAPVAERKAEPDKDPAPVAAASDPEIVGVLDPDHLAKALDGYVGTAPAPLGNRPAPASDMARYKERDAVRAFYAARKFAPVWIENGTFDAKARAVLSRIDHAAEDGLDLRAAGVSPPRDADAGALAAAELAMTEAAASYGRQASGGRIDPAKIDALIGSKPDVADAARVLAAIADAPDAGEALRAFNPPQRGYARLREKLAELRQQAGVATRTVIPYGPTLKTGMRDPRVPLIRARFGLDLASGDTSDDGLRYDTEVASAVADFQKAHHLPASGVLTIRTVAALSGGEPSRLEDEIVANMERWRWLPRDMGENHIEVNIPDFSVDVMHGDSVFHHARVIVGKPDKQTPLFSDTMKFIVVNPYWNVPLSIVKKEMMPKLEADPNYFADHGYETVERNGQTYVRQPPGDSNALGRITFMFPNQYAVYLHDTNAHALFGNDRRDLSHGCVRVEAPFKFAEVVLGKENGWTEARVKKLIGGSERTINLPQPLPIHMVYFTAFVDEAGALQTRDDVYGYSAKVKAALGLEQGSRTGQVAVN